MPDFYEILLKGRGSAHPTVPLAQQSNKFGLAITTAPGRWLSNASDVQRPRQPMDDVAVVSWYRKAANQDHVKALSNLGVVYLNGHGVTCAGTDRARFRLYR
jgi:TPR repeat protein